MLKLMKYHHENNQQKKADKLQDSGNCDKLLGVKVQSQMTQFFQLAQLMMIISITFS